MSDLIPFPGDDLEHAPGQELDEPARPSMVIISLNREIDVDLSMAWLMDTLPGAPAKQLQDASLVLVTDPNARLAKVLKDETKAGEYLEMHTGAIG